MTTSLPTIPGTIIPMLANLAREPFDSPDYIFELKWDGIRAIAYVEAGQVRLYSRTGRDITSQFPELAGLPKQLEDDSIVLDGELVSLDEESPPSFSQIQRRLQRSGKQLARRTPVHYIAFDLLYPNGHSVMKQPLSERENLLHKVLEPNDLALPCEFIETDGKAFLQATCDRRQIIRSTGYASD